MVRARKHRRICLECGKIGRNQALCKECGKFFCPDCIVPDSHTSDIICDKCFDPGLDLKALKKERGKDKFNQLKLDFD